MSELFWLIIVLAILIILNNWITAHVQGVGYLLTNSHPLAVWLYFFLFLPGIFIHEVSHYLMAVLLRVKVSKFSLWPEVRKRGELVLGSVEVRGAGPLRHSLVGAAPLFVGAFFILFIGRFLQLDMLGQIAATGNLSLIFDTFLQSFSTPDFWLWLYLLFAIANAMIPSRSDRIYWLPIFLFCSVIAIISMGFNLIPFIPPIIETTALSLIEAMLSALSMAVVVDVLFIIFITLLEFTLTLTTRRKVSY